MTNKKMKNFGIGIDPGRHTGIAWYHPTDRDCHSEDIGKHDSVQLANLVQLVAEYVHELRGSCVVCYEEPAQLRGHALIQIQRQIGVIMATCERLKVPHYPVNQATLKAWVRKHEDSGPVGRTMDKDAMIRAAVHAGANVDNHNEADAYWLSRYAYEVVGPQVFGVGE